MMVNFEFTDKQGKQKASRGLQNEPKQLMWWVFAINIASDTVEVIGSGLIA